MIDRYERMLQHLLAQFTDTKVLKAIFYAISEELTEIAIALDDLQNKRWIDTGEGVQLDGIGELIGRNRKIAGAIAIPFFGFEGQINTKGFGQARFRDYSESFLTSTLLQDPEYKTILWAKVFKNNSLAYGDDTLKSIQTIFKTKNVIVQNAGNAKIIIGIGKKITESDILLINKLDLFVRAAGIGFLFISDFDGYAFGFKGQAFTKGFGKAAFATTFSTKITMKGRL